ncbi:MAG: DUF192 domain-containing protein [Pseudomonadota bacterium]
MGRRRSGGPGSARARLVQLLALVWVALLAPAAALAACAPDRVDLRGPWGSASFNVEVVDTPESRAQGLMHRESLPTSSGMLFVYEQAGAPTFWMKNTLIPLDMIFVRPDGVVQHVHAEAVPLDERTRISGGEGILSVLEINGGLSARLGIAPGTEMRHPSFGPGAAWPCDGAAASGG